MKKIMFNDKYGLTQAVLDGRKTMTRRVAIDKPEGLYKLLRFKDQCIILKDDKKIAESPYKVGEVIAIAQSYNTLEREIERLGLPLNLKPEIYKSAGYKNKMFVKAEHMPHHIEITHISLDYLGSISDEDCLCEGIVAVRPEEFTDHGVEVGPLQGYSFQFGKICETPRDAFKLLVKKTMGSDVWNNVPLVWVYLFKLID